MNPTFAVVFDLDPQSANFGKIIITVTSNTGADPSDVIGFFRIDFPSGFYQGNSTNPDIELDVSNIFTIDIPKDANGEFMEGNYSFHYTEITSGAIDPGTRFASGQFKFCPEFDENPCIEVKVDCFKLQLTSVDKTNYGVPTTLSRTHKHYFPPSLGLSPATTSSATLVTQFSFTGSYEIEIDTVLTYVDGIFTINARVKGSVFEQVKCDIDLCGISNCYEHFLTEVRQKASIAGGFDRIQLHDRDKIIDVLTTWNLFDNSLKCGKYKEATEAYHRLKSLLKCDCGCGKGDEPKLINPYCSGGSGGNVVVQGSSPVVVTSSTVGDTTTYLVSLNSTTTDLLASITSTLTTIQTNITNLTNTVNGLSVVLLHTDTDEDGTDTSSGSQVLKTYSLAGDTISNGDELVIESVLRIQQDCQFVLQFGSTDLVRIGQDVSFGKIHLRSVINKIDDSTIYIKTDGYFGGVFANDGAVYTGRHFFAEGQVSIDLTTNQTLNCRAVRSTNFSTNGAVCSYLSVKQYKQ